MEAQIMSFSCHNLDYETITQIEQVILKDFPTSVDSYSGPEVWPLDDICGLHVEIWNAALKVIKALGM